MGLILTVEASGLSVVSVPEPVPERGMDGDGPGGRLQLHPPAGAAVVGGMDACMYGVSKGGRRECMSQD